MTFANILRSNKPWGSLAMKPLPLLQRTEGALRLGFSVREGKTIAAETFQSGALRVRFPRALGPPEAVILNTAGGLTGGDVLTISLRVGAGAQAVIAGQACEKIYKSAQGKAVIRTAITLSDNAALDYLPQPTILFDHARLERETTAHIAEESRLLALEAGILGRTAMDEEFREGALRDVWKIWREGRLVFSDALALTGEAARALKSPWALDRTRAYATLIHAAPNAEERIDEMRGLLSDMTGAASAWNGVLVTRLVAPDGYTLMRMLSHILGAFRKSPLPRLWSI